MARGRFCRGRAVMVVTVSIVGMALSTREAQGSTDGGCRSNRHVVCVDRADSGHNVHVRVGQTVKVDLHSSDLRWSGLREVGPRRLREVGPVDSRAGGLAASYAAVSAGRTDLQASAAAKCSGGQACPQFILLWRVHVVITE